MTMIGQPENYYVKQESQMRFIAHTVPKLATQRAAQKKLKRILILRGAPSASVDSAGCLVGAASPSPPPTPPHCTFHRAGLCVPNCVLSEATVMVM